MNSDIDIYNFLPKYPNIKSDSDEYYMNPYENKDFNQVIYEKKEFDELEPFEDKPKIKGDLMKHQINISRFLSNYTLYDGLLIFHAMGTGKTCSAIGTIEKIRQEEDNIYKRAIILGRGKGILNNILNELVFVCTDGRYIPDDYEKLSKDNQKIGLKKKVSDFYTFETYYKFSKTLEGMNEQDIITQFDNSIIVCDEVHNLHLKTKTKELYVDIYKQLHRLFHILYNKKILLLSGTPMKDKP
jgi:superfamily II DNA or RNA helicase